MLWTEEGLPLATALQMLHGKVLYRDIWFDKPPLVPLASLLFGAKIGFVLRVAGAVYVFACCFVAWLFAKSVAGWGPREGLWAAGLLGFVLTFDTPSAVLPLAADLLLVLPHLAAVYLAYRRRAFWSGVAAGIAFLTNVKAAFVLLACTFFVWPAVPPLAIGFVLPCAIGFVLLWITGAWPAYLDQVWIWPSQYAGSSHVSNPIGNGALRTLNWTGFHLGLIAAAGLALFWKKVDQPWKWLVWLCLSFVGVALGGRFFPRYYFQLLPVFVLLAARGFVSSKTVLSKTWIRYALLALFLIPLIRFGPRYPVLALNRQPDWSDTAMDSDSREAARRIGVVAQSDSTLYVWGYRPDIFVYTGLKAASRYLDSQAMTGVPADRHLSQTRPVTFATTADARRELARSHPDFIADGLSLYNPGLSMSQYPELRPWLANYREFGRTRTTILYRRALR